MNHLFKMRRNFLIHMRQFNLWRSFWIWLATSVPLGPLTPYALGIGLGSWPEKVEEKHDD